MNAIDRAGTVAPNTTWSGLYRVGAAASLSIAVVYVAEIATFLAAGPSPTTVLGWFTLLRTNPLLGEIDLYLLEVPLYALMGVLFLALYVALRRMNESYMALATLLAVVGITLYLALNPALSMLSLSNQYAAATTDSQRTILLAAGQAYLVMTQGTGFSMAFILTTLAGLIVSAVMLRGAAFSNWTAYVGIVTNALLLTYYVPPLQLILWTVGGLLFPIWFILLGWGLLRLGRLASGTRVAVSHRGAM